MVEPSMDEIVESPSTTWVRGKTPMVQFLGATNLSSRGKLSQDGL